MKRKIELKVVDNDWTDIVIDGENIGYILELEDGHLIFNFRKVTKENIGVHIN
jgi:hypothetical protein